MDDDLKANLFSAEHWFRFLYMVFFIGALYIAAHVLLVVVCCQFLFALVTSSDNSKLRRFGGSLTSFISQAALFVTYNEEEKPFPFADWPDFEDEVVEEEFEQDYDEPDASYDDEDVSDVDSSSDIEDAEIIESESSMGSDIDDDGEAPAADEVASEDMTNRKTEGDKTSEPDLSTS